MAYIDLTTKNFDEIRDNNEIIIIDFWAQWCGPCIQFAPTFEKVSDENPDITFGKLNIDEQSAIANYYGVSSVPTIVVIRDGIVLLNRAGSLPEDALNDIVTHVKSINMDEIRSQLEKEEAEEE
ncbi:thioredoxin [Sulfurimonas sp. MAG313]|nr:thioredoxin [Sulfurimonas sp. MAG313]MDF1881215.1 thioredoxin [Sulfurimonas sp. MAG313]